MADFVSTFHLSSYPELSPERSELSVAGKSVIVTGGGYGIGQSIADAFAAAGAARIAISGRNEGKLISTAAELEAKYPKTEVNYYAADITDAAAVTSMFESFGPPDIVVNNAGFLVSPENLKTVDLTAWWEGFEINVLGTATVIQTFLRTKNPENEAVVVTLNTMGAHWGRVPGLSSYAAGKAASLRMIELFQVEHPEVRFVSVHPGVIKTAMAEKSGLKGMPFADADLAANFILWTTSPEADFLAGRFAWANWDVNELKAKKREILDKNLLQYTIAGFV
ncbi:hypothetical protein V1506DRAFT_315747 [Lipomyces tetrasporus]